jgi:hypothetical protein
MCKSVLNFAELNHASNCSVTLKYVGRVGHCNVDLITLSFPAIFLLIFATTADCEHTQEQSGIVAFLYVLISKVHC